MQYIVLEQLFKSLKYCTTLLDRLHQMIKTISLQPTPTLSLLCSPNITSAFLSKHMMKRWVTSHCLPGIRNFHLSSCLFQFSLIHSSFHYFKLTPAHSVVSASSVYPVSCLLSQTVCSNKYIPYHWRHLVFVTLWTDLFTCFSGFVWQNTLQKKLHTLWLFVYILFVQRVRVFLIINYMSCTLQMTGVYTEL